MYVRLCVCVRVYACVCVCVYVCVYVCVHDDPKNNPGMKIALAQSPNATCFPAWALISELYSPSLRIDITSMRADILETVVQVRIFFKRNIVQSL